MGGDPDKRMSVLGPHVFDGVPLILSAARGWSPVADRAAVIVGVHRRGSDWPGRRGRTGRSAAGCPLS